MKAAVEFQNISKIYGDQKVIDSLNLSIAEGGVCDLHRIFGVWKNNAAEND